MKKTKQPQITVIMPVYNGEKYLQEAIDSILNQTFKDFEFLIINDGSTDNTLKIIKTYKDQRIRLISNKSNLGIISSLNKGFKLAQGHYIARADADDLSFPTRLEEQVKFLNKNSDHGVIGTAFFIMDSDRKIRKIAPIVFDDEDIKFIMAFQNPLAHGSVMLRRSLLIDHNLFYRKSAKHYEDYDLWIRLASKTKMANLPQVLYCWMNNPQGITRQNSLKIKQGVALLINKLKEESLQKPPNNLNIKEYWQKSHFKINNQRYRSPVKEGYQYLLLRLAIISLKRKRIKNFLLLFLLGFIIEPIFYVKLFYRPIKKCLLCR